MAAVTVALPPNLVELISCKDCGNQGAHEDFYNQETETWECPVCSNNQDSEQPAA